MNVIAVSFQVSDSTGDNATFTGNFTALSSAGAELPSQAQTIGASGGKTIPGSPDKPVDGCVITCVQGTVNVDLYF